MDNYEAKRLYLYSRQEGFCAINKYWFLLHSKQVDLHHLCHNTKWRRKVFPLFLNSILNLRLVDHMAHLNNPSALKIHDLKAEQYERFLDRHPKISDFVNNPI